MNTEKKVNRENLLNILTNKTASKTVLLFNDSKQLKDFNKTIGNVLQDNVKISFNTPYKVTNNMIRVSDNIVYLGLKNDENLLLKNYSESEIKYYGEE